MAKVGGHWRGFVSAIAVACGMAGVGMVSLGWLDRDLDHVGRDMLSGLRNYLDVSSAPAAVAPERPELYYTSGRNPLPELGSGSYGPASSDERAMRLHASRGALIGYPTLIDGDTLKLGGRTVTFWGVDAPELGQPCTLNGRGWRCGHEAAKELADYIAGRHVACYDKGTDTDGRMIGQCFVGSHDVAGWMARNGWVFARRSVTWNYISDESFARGKRIGVWRSTGVEAPWEWRRSH